MKIEERVKTVVLENYDLEKINGKHNLYADFCDRFGSCNNCPLFHSGLDCELTVLHLANNGINVLTDDFTVVRG